LLVVSGNEGPLTYGQLLDQLYPLGGRVGGRVGGREQLRPKSIKKNKEVKVRAFREKVIDFLLRDINDGGCPDNWELLSYVAVDPAHFGEVFEDEGKAMVPVYLDTFHRAVGFLRNTFKGKSISYEESTVVDAFRETAAAHLTNFIVESEEVDVVGTAGDCYTQRYHYAHVHAGDANGEGSFRCLMTKATQATTIDLLDE